MPKPITAPDVVLLLPFGVAQALQDLADGRKQTVPELLDEMVRKAQKEPKARPVPAPDPTGAVPSGRSQGYVRPGYNTQQRPETEAEKDIYFGRVLPSVA